MNAERRKSLAEAIELLNRAHALIQDAADTERDYYDAMPEGVQAGEKGDRASEVADALECAAGSLVDLIEEVEGAAA